MVTVTFKTDNEAFDGQALFQESARILKIIAYSIERGNDSGNCRDINGNKVGKWSLEGD